MGKRIISAVLAALMLVSLAVSATAADYPEDRLRRIKLSNTSMTMMEGATRQLTVTYTPYTAYEEITWTSSDTSTAIVSDGLVEAVGSGSAIITAKSSSGVKATCRVTVRGEKEKVRVNTVEVSPSSVSVSVGQTRQVMAYITPADATNKDIDWTSSDTSVAEVDAYGSVIGIAPGTTTVIATSVQDGRSGTCKVVVLGTATDGSTNSTATTPTSTNEYSAGQLLASDVKPAVETVAQSLAQGETGTASFRNKTSVSATVLRTAASTAQAHNRTVNLRVSTAGADGAYKAFLTVNPRRATDLSGNISLGVYVDSSNVKTAKDRFAKYYSNKVAVVDIAQSGSFGMTVSVGAKVDLTGMNTDNLRFYVYDLDNNRYRELEVSAYRVDSNGYLRFDTSTGGVIVVSEGALRK